MSRGISAYCCRAWLGAGFLLLSFYFSAFGNPTGGSVTHGSATFSSSGSTFNINQTSANASISWQSFNIGQGETVNFNQPSATSITFNQINQGNPSQILGDLNANGYVVLENASGFYIGGSAVFNVHGLIMTTATPTANFTDGGPWSFDAPPPTAKIQNYGQINITGGGTCYLIAADIVNGGTITAPNGQIGLYDGETVLVSMSPNAQSLSAQVTLPQGSVDNEGNLTANGGSVVAQAQFVNQNGIIQANTVQNVNGTIELLASSSVTLGANSVISATGDSTASSASQGGFVVLNAGTSYSDVAGSTISVSGNANGGQGGIVEIFDPQAGSTPMQTTVSGAFSYLVNPYDITLSGNGTGTSYDANNNLDANFNVNDLAAYSQIDLQALDNIELSAGWTLNGSSLPAVLGLTAGNDILLDAGSAINAGSDWTVNLTAGTGFVPTSAQPTPASGSDGIYLSYNSEQNSSIQSQNGNINLWAANEVQVGWSGSSAGPGQVNAGPCSITTASGGNINVTTVYGDVNTGSDPNGFVYTYAAPYFKAASNLGGISTAAGGNVAISAGGDVISFLSDNQGDAGTGAFGTQPGNVTINAAGSVYGHYVVSDGTGTITAGQNAGSSTENIALSLSSGGWSVNAPNGSIYLQEVRNPNGVFNSTAKSRGSSGQGGTHYFTYNPDAYVDLTANAVYLTGQNVPRLSDSSSVIPILYPSILNINAGSGGITLENSVTLFPSLDQNLDITTTDGGNLIGTGGFENPYQLYMSDSAAVQWTVNAFSDSDHGSLADEPSESSPVLIDVSGDMEDLSLITSKVTDINIGGDMIDCSFSGQNLQASDVTSINVAGQIYNTSPYSFVDLSQAIANIPAGDLLTGMGNSWDDIFSLAINPALLASFNYQSLQGISPSQWASQFLEYASQFDYGGNSVAGQLTGLNPGFVYNATTGRLGFTGSMNSALLSELSQPITILHLVNGAPVINPATGQFETDTISWVNASSLQSLYTASQGNPPLSADQPGYQLGGPGQFDITAGSIFLGNSDGILSDGIYDPTSDGRFANLSSITPAGATINVTVTGPDTTTPSLDMLTSTIASLDGGSVTVISEAGSMDLGSPELINGTGSAATRAGSHQTFGIYTTGGGDVSVIAEGDVDIDGSRIASYDGGNIFVESLAGNVDVGSGSADLNTIDSVYSGELDPYSEDVFGSGIVANTLVPAVPGESFPPDAAKLPGNIIVEATSTATGEGNITSTSAGIVQEALDGSITPGPSVLLNAGNNIDLGGSGVIGGTVSLTAKGSIKGQIVSRQNSNITAGQSFTGTLLSGGQGNLSAGGGVSGTIIGVGGVNVSGGSGVSATLLGQNVSVNGGASKDALGSSATATSATQSAAQQASRLAQQQVVADQMVETDNKKKPKVEKIGRVTVLLSAAIPK